MLLWTFLYMYCGSEVPQILRVESLGVDFQVKEYEYVQLITQVKTFFKQSIHTLTSSGCEFPLLHILANTRHCQFILAFLINCLSVKILEVLVFIS